MRMPRLRRIAPIALVMIVVSILTCGCLNPNQSSQGELGQVQDLELNENTVYLKLSWSMLEEADYYRVIRGGETIVETSRCYFNDSDVEQGIIYNYQICGVRTLIPIWVEVGPTSQAVSGMLLAVTMNDTGFREFATDTGEVIQGIAYDLRDFGMAMDLGASRELAEQIVEVCSKYLSMSNEFNISEAMEPAMEEYRMAMEDFIQAGQYMVQGIDSLNQGMVEDGIDLSYQGAEHLRIVSTMI